MNMKRTLGRLAIAMAAAGLMASAMAETTIAYITNGNTNEGWTLINGGAKAAGANLFVVGSHFANTPDLTGAVREMVALCA
jgi:ABC-type sugar transport system substrate-binding protein